MKTKPFSKKLKLNKNTIANLGRNEMQLALGGATSACETYIPRDSVCVICTGQCIPETTVCSDVC